MQARLRGVGVDRKNCLATVVPDTKGGAVATTGKPPRAEGRGVERVLEDLARNGGELTRDVSHENEVKMSSRLHG